MATIFTRTYTNGDDNGGIALWAGGSNGLLSKGNLEFAATASDFGVSSQPDRQMVLTTAGNVGIGHDESR